MLALASGVVKDVRKARFDMCINDCTLEITVRKVSSGCLYPGPKIKTRWRKLNPICNLAMWIHNLKHSCPGWITYPQLKVNPPKWVADTWTRNKCFLLHGTEIVWLFITWRKLADMLSVQIPDLHRILVYSEIYLIYGSLLVPIYSGTGLCSLYKQHKIKEFIFLNWQNMHEN